MANEEKMYDWCVRGLYIAALLEGTVPHVDEWLNVISSNISLCPSEPKRLSLEYLLTRYAHLRNFDIANPEEEEEFHQYCSDCDEVYELIKDDETTLMLLKVVDSYISGTYLIY